jgi:elongation factor P--beta-lysine ligase
MGGKQKSAPPTLANWQGADFRVGSGITEVTSKRLENRHSRPILYYEVLLTGEISPRLDTNKKTAVFAFPQHTTALRCVITLSNT